MTTRASRTTMCNSTAAHSRWMPRPLPWDTPGRCAKIRVMSAVHSICPLDCPDRCSLEVKVEGGRVASITGSRVHALTDGFICAKVREYPRRVYGPDRVPHPLRLSGPKGSGRFERVSWDDAVTTIARRFDEIRGKHGGEAILPFSYGGSNGLLTQGTTDE